MMELIIGFSFLVIVASIILLCKPKGRVRDVGKIAKPVPPPDNKYKSEILRKD